MSMRFLLFLSHTYSSSKSLLCSFQAKPVTSREGMRRRSISKDVLTILSRNVESRIESTSLVWPDSYQYWEKVGLASYTRNLVLDAWALLLIAYFSLLSNEFHQFS
jgi:hypothetical protein